VVGDIWWDKQIDEMVGDWELQFNSRAERMYVNVKTGEKSWIPPSCELDLHSFYYKLSSTI
jgi:hypothetical protein